MDSKPPATTMSRWPRMAWAAYMTLFMPDAHTLLICVGGRAKVRHKSWAGPAWGKGGAATFVLARETREGGSAFVSACENLVARGPNCSYRRAAHAVR